MDWMHDSPRMFQVPTTSLGRWSSLGRRYVRFCLVGASGVGVDMGVLWLLADPRMLGWHLILSKVLAAEAAMINNFLWNDLWTFRGLTDGADGWRARLVRLGKFHLICLAGIGWGVLLLHVQVNGLGLNVYVANFLAIVVVSLWNFGLNLKFGWRTAPGVPPPGAGAQAAPARPGELTPEAARVQENADRSAAT